MYFFKFSVNFWPFLLKITIFVLKIAIVRLFIGKISSFGRVFSTGNLSLIRVPQYWINGLKGGCKGPEYSKMLKIPLCLSTGMASDTLIYHNACNCNIFFLTTTYHSFFENTGIVSKWILKHKIEPEFAKSIYLHFYRYHICIVTQKLECDAW